MRTPSGGGIWSLTCSGSEPKYRNPESSGRTATLTHQCTQALVRADGAKKGLDLMTVLEFDLSSFNKHIPRMARPQSIGHGVGFLNR